MARPKTYEEMLGEMLNGGSGGGGFSDPGATTSPIGSPDYSPTPPTPSMPSGPRETLPFNPKPTTSPVATAAQPFTPPVWNPWNQPGYATPPPGSSGPVASAPTVGPIDPIAQPPSRTNTGFKDMGPMTNGSNTWSQALDPGPTTNPVGDLTAPASAPPQLVQPWNPSNPSGRAQTPFNPSPTTGPINGPGVDPSILKKTGQLGMGPDEAVTNTQGRRRSSNDVGALIKELTGRDATEAERTQWGNDIDDQYFEAIRRTIAGGEEAQAYARRSQEAAAPVAPPPAAAAPGGDNWASMDFSNPDNVRRFFQSRGVTASDSSVNYWAQKYNSPEFAGDRQYFLQRLGQAEEFGGGGGEFSDPWGRALEGRVGQYDQASRERGAALAKTYQDRAAELRQPAYSSGDEAVIRAKAFDQLERRRQETLKNDREGVYARGFAPTSGLVRDATNKTNTNFEGARTGIESNLLQSSLDENQRRKDAAVQLEALATQALNGGDLSALQALGLPLSLMNTRQQTAGSLLNSSNSQSMNSILQILAMLQSQQGANNAQAGSQAGGWGALIPILLGALGGG